MSVPEVWPGWQQTCSTAISMISMWRIIFFDLLANYGFNNEHACIWYQLKEENMLVSTM